MGGEGLQLGWIQTRLPLEQKNWTHGRQWLDYHCLDNENVVSLLNELYKTEWRLFHNFFCPSVKLVAKQRIASNTLKRYDNPKTPFQRVMESPHIVDSVKQNLKEQSLSLNPFFLRKAMEIKLKRIFMLCYKPQLWQLFVSLSFGNILLWVNGTRVIYVKGADKLITIWSVIDNYASVWLHRLKTQITAIKTFFIAVIVLQNLCNQ